MDTKLDKGLIIKRSPHQLSIEKKWFNPLMAVILIGFGTIWTLISSYIGYQFLVDALMSTPFPFNLIILVFALIPILFVLIGIGILYTGACNLLNTSSLVVKNDALMIKTGPLPWFGRQQLNRQKIRQIYVKKGSRDQSNDYNLYYIDNMGKSHLLFGGLANIALFPFFKATEAQEIERVVEDFLGIKNEAVSGELGYEEENLKEIDKADTFLLAKQSLNQSLREEKYADETKAISTKENSLGLLAVPTTLVVEELPEGLFVFKRWSSYMNFFFIPFAIIWNAVVITGTLAILHDFQLTHIFFLLFLIPFWVVGIGLFAKIIANFLNNSTLHLNQEMLYISHGPISFKKATRILTPQIKSINAEEKTSYDGKGNTVKRILLQVETTDNEIIDLTKYHFDNFTEEEAYFLEKRIRRYLHK